MGEYLYAGKAHWRYELQALRKKVMVKMDIKRHKRKQCRLCDSRRLELALHLESTPIGDDYVKKNRLNEVQATYLLDLFLCGDCGHVQMLEVLNPETVFGDYLFETSSSKGLIEHFKNFVEDMSARKKLQKGALAVDIGSNDGTLLGFFKQKGLRVVGIDPARNIARKATKSGIETLAEFFSLKLAKKIKIKFGSADIITAANVFAHIDDLSDVTEGIRHLLSRDGIFVFEVSYLGDIIEKMLFDTIYHEHLSYHSVKPLKIFFDKHGLELYDIEHIKSKGGSIRCFVRLKGAGCKISKIVCKMIAREEKLGYDKIESFVKFADKINSLKMRLLKIINKIEKDGKKIAGYGASVTVTTLIYHLGIGKKMMFIADDNAKRESLFSPGFHIPVRTPTELYRKKIDFVIILAWNYAEPIMRKHQSFLNKGGHFIIPAPKVKVI